MSYRLFIGIDTAKFKYDFHCLDSNGNSQLFGEIDNCSQQLTDWLNELLEAHALSVTEVLICIENSGVYSLNLAHLAHEMGFHVWMEDALQLSRSFGRVRGKTDKIDAARVAKYAHRNHYDVKLFTPMSDSVARIKSLVAQRRRAIKAKNILAVPINEETEYLPIQIGELHQTTNDLVVQMEQAVKELDRQIDELIKADQELTRKEKLATSVPGFKKVNFRNLVIATEGFTRLNNPRALVCNVGVAPFPRQSGKCLNKKPKTSKMGNNTFKGTLTCAVMSIIRSDNRFGRYYRRKIAQGKNILLSSTR